MDRLTYKLGEQNPSYGLVDKASAKPGLFTDYDGFYAHLLATHRLGAYEDTGLTPAEVAELAKAKAEGRLVVLPCNVGDTVYLIVHGYVEETKVRTFFFGHPSYSRGEPDPRYEMIRCTNYDVPMKNFGKTVFLTHADAEKAAKEREQK